MVRQGSLVTLSLAFLASLNAARAADEPAARTTTEAFDTRPYRIHAFVSFDPGTRIDARRREMVLADWESLVRRFVGAPWEFEASRGESNLVTSDLELLETADFEPLAKGWDKVWAIRVERDGAGLALSGREYDATVRRVEPLRRLRAPIAKDLPRALLRLAIELFAPLADIGESQGGGVAVLIRGAGLEAASAIGRVAGLGTVFEPYRLVTQPNSKVQILRIPFSYLRVESMNGASAHCAILSALRDPLTRRIARKNRLVALGVRPGDRATRLRFVTRPEKAPAAGYVLTARGLPDGVAREVGTTDREGRLVLEPGFASGLVAIRLIAGNVEPMIEFPLMPGESADERTVPFDPMPATVALETELDSLRDQILDLVAVRARLEARMKARAEGEDWAGVAAALKEYYQLTPRDTFANKLTHLKEDAARQQQKSKKPILTKTAQAELSEIQALIDRYLDDEVAKSYSDAVDQATGRADRAKAAAKKKADASKPAPKKAVTPEPPTKKAAPRPPAPPARPANAPVF